MSMTLTQILNLVGKLDDVEGNDTPRERFRYFLKENAKDVGQLRDYIQECISNAGSQYDRALQDLVNYVGSFLEFEVEFGRYKGVQGENGFDGHWKSPKDFHIVTETKTTDAFTIKTATLMGYINGLISEKKIPSLDNVLGLYVVGRPDAELKQLENAIIAEKRIHQLRVITVDSLLSLAEMMSEYEVTHQNILDVLRPSGPRVDSIVDLMAGLIAQSQDEAQPAPAEKPNEPLTSNDVIFWLSPVKSHDEETAEQCINRLVGKGNYYAFGVKTPGRKRMKSGDRIAFYATTTGVVAHATLSSAPKKTPRPDGTTVDEYPWVSLVKDAQLYVDTPVAIDAKLRQQLDAFKGRNPDKGWAWFVQSTHKVSPHDFGVLTQTLKS